MSRVEENREIVEGLAEDALRNGDKELTFPEVLSWHLATMNTFISDISKSLAVIADKAESGGQE